MLSLEKIRKSLNAQKELLRSRYKISRLGIFGSYVRGEQQSGSDLDILVDYEEAPSLIALIEIENQLSELLGVKVDLVTRKGLRSQLRKQILGEVVYL
jgi:predicted nucleotidyltransferase